MAQRILLYILLVFLSSCGIYNQNIMFRTKSSRLPDGIALSAARAEKNYVIQKNDYVDIRLYANKGEKLIDFYIQSNANQGGGAAQSSTAEQGPRFLVQTNGYVKLPQVGMILLEGLTLQQADSVLEKAYTDFYEEPFVTTRYSNKRVIIMGATTSQVVPLSNENMNIIEVIALSGGVTNNARVKNIRLIRGDLNNPEVHLIDLSTVEGMARANLKVEANDIIYIEPVRKILVESIADISPIIGLFSSVISIVTLVIFLQNQQ